MATNFKVGTVILNRQTLTATGGALLLNGIEVGAGTSGNLTQTGVALGATIAQTGSDLYRLTTGFSGQSVIDFASKLSLGQTGSILYGISTGISGVLQAQITGKQDIVSGISNYPYLLQSDTDRESSGLVTGGTITSAGALVNIAAGAGYINDGTALGKRVAWGAFSSQAAAGLGQNYVGIDTNGNLVISSTKLTGSSYIILGHYYLNPSLNVVTLIWNIPRWVGNFASKVNDFVADGLGTIIASGFIVAEQSAPHYLNLNIGAGQLFVQLTNSSYALQTGFTKIYGTSDFDIVRDTGAPNTVNVNQWNDISQPKATALPYMQSGYWKKDVVLISAGGSPYYAYGQAQYADEDSAKQAPIPYADRFLSENNALLFTIVHQASGTSIANRLYDVRPILTRAFGTSAASAAGLTIDYSQITNRPTHNQLPSIQGGTTSEYYHLTSGEYTGLAGYASNAIMTGMSGQSATDYATKTQLTNSGVAIETQINSVSGFTLGASGALQAQIAAGGTQVKITGSSTLAIADITGIGGINVLSSGGTVFISGGSVTQGQLDSASGYAESIYVHRTGAELITGDKTFASDIVLNANIYSSGCVAGGVSSHAQGRLTRAIGNFSHAEGNGAKVSGDFSHAEGFNALAFGLYSHAEGIFSLASGDGSHAEGNGTLAAVDASHAEGYITTANGLASHAEGYATVAERPYSHAQGIYNRIGVNGLFQVGRGTSPVDRVDIIYVSDNASNPSILSGNWVASKGFKVYDATVVTGVIDGTNITSVNNSDGTITITAAGSVTQAQLNSLSGFTTGASGFLQTEISALPTSAQLAQTGSNLYVLTTGLSGQIVLDYATKTQLTSSGVQLAATNLITSGTLATGIAQTGQAAYLSAVGAATTLSGNATLTGQQILTIIANLSGVQEGVVVHRTGVELITGIKTFMSELRFNSGLKTPERFFGSANYSLISGDYIVVATGAVANVTGILPVITDNSYSGVLFTLINARTTSLPVSGVIGPDTNPIIAPNDAIQVYGGSGVWHYIRQTGSPIWADQNNNAINLSGALTASGAALVARDLVTSGTLATGLFNTGAAAITYANSVGSNLSGNLALTGSSLYNTLTGESGSLITTIIASGASAINHTNGAATNLSGNMTLTGQALINRDLLVSGWLSTGLFNTGAAAVTYANSVGANTSGTLTASGQLLSAVKVSGSSVINVANFTGLGGVTVLYSGTTIYISGITGAGGAGGGITQGQLDAVSGWTDSVFVHRTGNEIISGIKTFFNDIVRSGAISTFGSLAAGTLSSAEGFNTTASGNYTHAEGNSTITFASSAHSEGLSTIASGFASHAEGDTTRALGFGAHSEGSAGVARGDYSHVAGHAATAFGQYAHAEGDATNASGIASHAEGQSTQALASWSHAEGFGTVTERAYSHAQGIYNRTGASGLFQVGRGSSDTGRIDVIYISDYDSNRSILSGDWTVSTGFRVYNTPVITGLIAGSSNVTTTNNLDGTFTVNAVISGTATPSATTTGTYIFRTAITSGVSQQFINFPVTLSSNPRVLGTVYSNYTNSILPFQISGAVSTGFWALYGNTVPTTGYFFDAMGITSDTGLAATVIIQQVATGVIQLACSDLTTAIVAGTTKGYFRMPYAANLTSVRASALGAPAGASIVIDINQSGFSVLSTKMSIDAGTKTSLAAGTPPVISTGYLPNDTEVTIDFDQVGSTNAGTGIMVSLFVNPV